MTGARKALTAAGIAAAILYAVTRSEKGQTLTVDAIEAVMTGLGALPRGIRNNNPGNIRYIADPARAWRGQTGQDAGGFGVYDTAANGVRALAKQLLAYEARGIRTPRAIAHTWAPPNENDSERYADVLARAVATAKDSPIDVRGSLAELASAIIKHENGIQPYSERELRAWVNLA